MAETKRVALYGGSFNPPHVCHVLVATWVLCREPVDELRIIPVYNHAFGKDLASFDARCAMLESALSHLGPQVSISRIEAELGAEKSYTIDTVRALKAKEPDIALSFVCGTDVYADRRKWKDWDALDDLLDFIVIGREGEPPVRDDDGSLIVPRTTLPDISSSGIREALAQGKPAPAGWLPREVARYMDREQLYR